MQINNILMNILLNCSIPSNWNFLHQAGKLDSTLLKAAYENSGVHYEIKEFMLVPYIGACIHVPPPPANQLVYVISDLPWENDFIWDPIWITGEISIGGQNTIISLNPHETYQANAGYEMVCLLYTSPSPRDRG